MEEKSLPLSQEKSYVFQYVERKQERHYSTGKGFKQDI